jgi:hypothetical protein
MKDLMRAGDEIIAEPVNCGDVLVKLNHGLIERRDHSQIREEPKMFANLYFDAAQHHPQQPQITPEAVLVNNSFGLKWFPVRPLPYIVVVALLALSLFSVNWERSEALVHSPLPLATASMAEPFARLSLPARAALYRENAIAH